MRFLLPLALLLAWRPTAAAAQTASSIATWDSVFASAWHAADARDWTSLARQADPRALATLRERAVDLQRELAELPSEPGDTPAFSKAARRRTYEQWKGLSPESAFVRLAVDEVDAVYRHDALRPAITRSVLGHVADGDSLAHIVFRYRAVWKTPAGAPPATEERVDVLTLRLADDRWRPVLNGGLVVPRLPPGTLIHAVQ